MFWRWWWKRKFTKFMTSMFGKQYETTKERRYLGPLHDVGRKTVKSIKAVKRPKESEYKTENLRKKSSKEREAWKTSAELKREENPFPLPSRPKKGRVFCVTCVGRTMHRLSPSPPSYIDNEAGMRKQKRARSFISSEGVPGGQSISSLRRADYGPPHSITQEGNINLKTRTKTFSLRSDTFSLFPSGKQLSQLKLLV
ncbi:unnamed protein product [Cyprideis torosa]|uniref:Uncharacterized protein n=1 Tax=Cyprideis torosa TaxID=163714 RepID=A0A7R8ZL85_9CRUS|nr:unnamed protein product [Cyprideis torosa]CAG0883075.1 unnamed protein product [Cyprideis torosa]